MQKTNNFSQGNLATTKLYLTSNKITKKQKASNAVIKPKQAEC